MGKKRILVAEDERIVALDVKNRLELFGYEVCGPVHSGEHAVQSTRESRPDLVLMDIMLEGEIDGVEAARLIQQQHDVPVIFLSAFSDEVTIDRAKISEPYGYIIKPFDGKDIHTIIEMALYKHGMESRLKKMERWLSTMVKSIGDGVITTDINGAVNFMNPAAEQLTGWDLSEIAGRELVRHFTIVNEGTREIIDDPVRRVLNDGGITQVDNSIIISRHGREVPITFSAAPILDELDEIGGVVFVFRDITERKRAEGETRETLMKLRRSMNALIDALALTVETRDPYTAGHQRRVTNLARAIAKEMDLPEDQIDGIRMAGVIHDLGKISVPAEILTRPGKLTPLEFSLIKTHPQVAYDILKTIEFPWAVAEIVYQHHEKIDGSGYPRGLKGGEILVEARILTVADVVEAMSSHRPHRASLGIESSLEEITKNRGTLYDTDAVDACIKLFTQKNFKL